MRRSITRLRRSQPTLFQPSPSRPSFQTLPPQIQAHTIQLLARLLRQHVDRARAGEVVREAHDE